MILGVDFDNTIVRYDDLFHRVAVEQGLIPATTPVRKNAVRDCLRQRGGEREWTQLQGVVYGARMPEALPFPGVKEFFGRAIKLGVPVYIISHKTRHPVIGPAYDLHRAARNWLTVQGFFDPADVGLRPDHVFFGLTRQEKIRIILERGCTHFVDDLEETFLEEAFPQGVVKVLFGRDDRPPGLCDVSPAETWEQVTRYVLDASN